MGMGIDWDSTDFYRNLNTVSHISNKTLSFAPFLCGLSFLLKLGWPEVKKGNLCDFI